MANELVFIIHIPTMYGIYAGKRMGWQGEWYDSTVNAMTLNNYLVNEQGEDRPFEQFMFVSDDEADIDKKICEYDGVVIHHFKLSCFLSGFASCDVKKDARESEMQCKES